MLSCTKRCQSVSRQYETKTHRSMGGSDGALGEGNDEKLLVVRLLLRMYRWRAQHEKLEIAGRPELWR